MPWLNYHNGSAFTTPDMDNDILNGRNCAVVNRGPWWHGECFSANFNARRVYWLGYNVSNFNNVEMKIRPKRCTPTTNN